MDLANGVKFSVLVLELAGTVLGNSLLCLLILKSRQLHSSASLNFIFYCRMTDMMNALLSIPFAMDYFIFKSGNLVGPAPTFAYLFIMFFSIFVTLSSVMLVLIDRLLIVKYPVQYRNKMKVSKARLGIIIAWVISVAVTTFATVLKFINKTVSPDEIFLNYIVTRPQLETVAGAVGPSTLVITGIVDPSVLLYREIKKRGQNEATRTHAGERRITKSCTTILIVMVLYLVSYLPFVIFNFLILFYGEMISDKFLYAIIFWQISSLVNPYLFIFRSSAIRETAVRILPAELAGFLQEETRNTTQEQN